MSKPIKIILIAAGALLSLFIVAAIVLVSTVDPNEYKGQIAQAVEENTGRQLTFEGDIGFRFFPWLGLEVGPVALGNAKGFSPQEMVRINQAEASIELLPLLTGNVSIGVIILDGFNLNLAVNKQGVTNWDDLTASKGAKEPKTTQPEEPAKESSGASLDSISIGGVKITNANVTYDDRSTGQQATIANLNLLIGEVGNNTPTPIDLGFDLKLNEPKIETSPTLTAVVTLDKDANTITLSDFILTLLDLSVTGNFFAKSHDKGMDYSGEIALAEMSAKKLMTSLGMEPLKTTDPAALTRISSTLKLSGNSNSAKLDNMTVKLDDTTIKGEGSVTNFAKPAIVFNVNVDDIDVDRYMPPATKGEATQSASSNQQDAGPVQEPDLSAMRELNLKAELTINKLKAMNLRITDILCDLVAKNGIITIDPFSAKLYDGGLTAKSVLNVNGPLATWQETAQLTGVQAGPLLNDLVGKDRLLGTTKANYAVSGSGLTPDNIKKSISGNASFAFTDGAINGINIAQMIRNAFNTLTGQASSKNEPLRTDFAALTGSALIKKGHITNDDLHMMSPLLRVNGQGWANLPKNNLDYNTKVKIVGSLKGQDGESIDQLAGVTIPIYAKGSLSDPDIGLDAKAMAQALLQGGVKGVEGAVKGVGDAVKSLTGSGSDSGAGDTKEGSKPGGILKNLF
ncbi:MAG: AsmA family protein [Desulfovibrio sp.]|nr:AsmA family protein [Desulfovibrio sp.]